MKSVRKGDLVWYETPAGQRRIGLVFAVSPNDYPPYAKLKPYLARAQRYGGRQKVPLAFIRHRVSGAIREEVLAALDGPKMDIRAS